MWGQARPAFAQERTWRRVRTHALGALVGLNFRDEKTVLGAVEAQVRTQAAVETVPCFVVAAYAFLLLAATEIGQGRIGLPLPKWRRMRLGERDSTPWLIGALRSQLWGRAIAKVQGPASVTGEGSRTEPPHPCMFI